MRLAKEIVAQLKAKYSIGTFSQFCDEPAEFDEASSEELEAWVSDVQSEAYCDGLRDYQPEKPKSTCVMVAPPNNQLTT